MLQMTFTFWRGVKFQRIFKESVLGKIWIKKINLRHPREKTLMIAKIQGLALFAKKQGSVFCGKRARWRIVELSC
jgi:hypothetical protein